MMDTSSDRARRRAAFLAQTQRTRAIGPDVIHALWLNDSTGSQEGFQTGAEAGLYQADLERDEVLRDIDSFERATRPA